MMAMGVPGRLAAVAVLAMAGGCAGSDPEEPDAAPVVCSSDAPFLIDDPTPTRAEVLDVQVGTGLDDAAATRRVSAAFRDQAVEARSAGVVSLARRAG